MDAAALAFWNSPLGAVMGFTSGALLGYLLLLPLLWWLNRRDRRRWRQEDAVRRQEDLVRQQLRDLEDQIRHESLPDWQREAIEAARWQEAEVRREARRRLGLPEEGSP